MPFFAHFRVYALLVFPTLLLLLLAIGCAPIKEQGQQKGKRKQEVTKGNVFSPASLSFLGDSACANCHPVEFKDHEATHHAVTLREMTRTALGRLAPPTGGRLPEHALAVVRQAGEGYHVITPGGTSEPLQFAFGSGKSGMTFVSILPDARLLEMRASYFPHQKQWKVTPGQRGLEPNDTGVEHEGQDARRCMSCHTTTLPSSTLTPEKRFYGVGCEACHGPASAHVTAMQSRPTTDLHIDHIAAWGARRSNEMCGRCHRNAPDVKTSVPDLRVTSRFQPYALMLSRCFKESNDTLSCATCHNPHQNTAHDRRAYEAICLNCHGGAEKTNGEKRIAEEGRRRRGEPIQNLKSKITSSFSKSCPINPRTGCIGCHMPAKQVLAGSMVGAYAPDHFIRVRRPELEAQWARTVQNDLLLMP